MFPIRDHNPSERTPYVTYGLILVNVAVFLLTYQSMNSPLMRGAFYYDWASVPRLVMSGEQTYTVFTSMFLHANFMHLGLNMLFLWIFGDNLEDAFGHIGFLLFYLAAGALAGFAHILSEPDSVVPMIGASGAIAGVMGGYLLLYPRARVQMVIVLFIFFKRFSVPAWVTLLFWFAMQIVNNANANADGGGVAYWAHIGGFVAGFILTLPYWLTHRGARQPAAPTGAPQVFERPSDIPAVRRRRR